MALPVDFPKDPYAILPPDRRYRASMPPLVESLRGEVAAWRAEGYKGASATSRALLNWWFNHEHRDAEGDAFRYYFAQREAVETVIWLHDVRGAKDKHDLMRFDSSGEVSTNRFPENWLRLVIKMATGSGKTKVMSLLLAWCYFHRLYEEDSDLAHNFLLIAPNIIVLDRLRSDFDGLRIFHEDPILPYNGHEGRDWKNDFQLRLHIQDEVGTISKTGNIFLTNIHRVHISNTKEPSADDDDTGDYFLGARPTGKTTDSKIGVEDIVRDIDELVVMNDEAHHIHDERMAWFKSIEDIHNHLVQKGARLALQIDVTATPRNHRGGIFVQTCSDYPLVEAIIQNVVKHPVLPDRESREKLEEKTSSKYTERYEDYIHLGVEEWKKVAPIHAKMNKKAVLFVMTDDTKNCDEVAAHLEEYPELKGAVLVIHTKDNGEISEAATGKKKKELDRLRKLAKEIDRNDSPYKAIVSVLVLREGWDVKNVTTIIGLRPYASPSNILPEQTLGRGLRLMYRHGGEEKVSVVGTNAFMDFVEEIRQQGVELEYAPMGPQTQPQADMVIEVDHDNMAKDIERLDIHIPRLTPRIFRNYDALDELDPAAFKHSKIPLQQLDEGETRAIIFRDITRGDVSHITELPAFIVRHYSNAVGFFARAIMDALRLFSGYEKICEKVKEFIENHLFTEPVDIEDENVLRNLAETVAIKTIIETFKREINKLTVAQRETVKLNDHIKVSQMRPFLAKRQECLIPAKSALNKITGDSNLELRFAGFLERCSDIISYAKNYWAINFRLDYVNANGNISHYVPDFLVKKSETEIFIVETKGREDMDVPHKTQRLKQWCEDVNAMQSGVVYDFVYVDEAGWDRYKPSSFSQLTRAFRKYKD